MLAAYKITNLVNGKCYIGITTRSIAARWSDHREVHASKCGKLYAAMRKHGIENFSIEHIASAGTREDLVALEQILIAQYASMTRGYNMTIGGDGPKGLEHSMSSREKMRHSQTGKKQSPETIAKRVIHLRGRNLPPKSKEWRERHSARMKGRSWTEDQREAIVSKLKGRQFTDEWRAKISEAKRGKTPSEATREAQKRGGWRVVRTPEHQRRLVESRKRNLINTEIR